MAESIYETLTSKTSTVPNEGESPQDFLHRLTRVVSKLPEAEFYELPEPAQHWSNDAVEAIEHKKPIQMLPGAPFANGADHVEAEDKGEAGEKDTGQEATAGKKATGGKKAGSAKAAAKAAAKPADGKKGKAAAKTKETKEAAPKAPKAAAAPKPAKVREAREPGVLHHLMEAVYADPKATAAQLKERVEAKHKIEVKEANAIGILQQFRRFVRFFHTKNLLKEVHLD